MAIPGQEQINVSNTENQSSNSDSLFTAFHKIQNNFSTLFSAASPFNTFRAGNGITANADVANSTITFTNTGVTSLIAGTGVTLANANGAYTISASGGNGQGGVTNVNVISSSLTVTGAPIISNGTIKIDIPTIPTGSDFAIGTYVAPTVTVDKFGRITAISNSVGTGTVTSVSVAAGPGMAVFGGTVTDSGTITVTNTGVLSIKTGTGLISSSPDGNGDITVAVDPSYTSGVTSVGVTSNSLVVTGGPITSTGSINIELPDDFTVSGNVTLDNVTTNQNVFVGNVLNVSGPSHFGSNITSTNAVLGNLATSNYFSGDGGLLRNLVGGNVTGQVANSLIAGTVYTNAQPNITSVGTLSSVSVTGNISAGNATLGNLVTANYFTGNGSLLTNIAGSNITGFVPNANVSNTAYSVTGSNVTGQVGNALIAGTVYSNAQPNITSVGTLISAQITGNVTANNANISQTLNVGNTTLGKINTFDANVANLLVIANTGDLMFNSVTDNTKGVVLQAPDTVAGATGTYIVWSLPNTTGNTNQFLTTNGSGAMKWSTLASSSAPSTASSAGALGTIAFDTTHIYVCIAANTWIRANAASW